MDDSFLQLLQLACIRTAQFIEISRKGDFENPIQVLLAMDQELTRPQVVPQPVPVPTPEPVLVFLSEEQRPKTEEEFNELVRAILEDMGYDTSDPEDEKIQQARAALANQWENQFKGDSSDEELNPPVEKEDTPNEDDNVE